MPLKLKRLRHWQFSVGVIMPAALLLVLTAATVLGFVLWSTNGVDERERVREARLADRAIKQQIAEIPHTQESVVIWDDAFEAARLHPDKTWLDNNLGVWLNTYYGYYATAIISDEDTPAYTALGERSPVPELFASIWPAIAPLVADLRSRLEAGALKAYADGGQYPSSLDVVSIDGVPSIVSIAPIVPEADRPGLPSGPQFLHVIVDRLDAAFAARLQRDYGFKDARFATGTTADPGLASQPVFDNSGRLIAVFEWQPSRPGIELLQQTGPVLGVAFLIASILVFALVGRLWASSSALERERLAARHQALHDALTGLPNRAQFDSQLSRDLSDQHQRWPIALLMLDLDRFKHVNDTLGHGAGDDVICAVGQRLRELVGPSDILARLGGDEFAIIHPCRDGAPSALALGNAIIEAVAKPFDVSGGEVFVGASVGLAVSSTDDHDPRELLRRADIALYEAKLKGRNRVVVYEAAMSARLQDRHTIEAELREALKLDTQLSVAFQPLYSGRTGDIAGAEALIRWTHPTLGQVSPARFVPIAENAGLIEALGEFVLRRACAFSARFPGRRIAVNISPAQLRNPRFPERLFDILVDTAMRPSDLELEITESILLDNEGPALEALTTFRKSGIRIALDDFGTGYSSLNYLKRYPVDCIKIDRSFVAQLVPRTASAAIVQAMVTLAHALNIEVTAEGVETHEQMAILKAMGCNLFQGFLLCPPTTEDAVEAKFRRAADRRKREVAA